MTNPLQPNFFEGDVQTLRKNKDGEVVVICRRSWRDGKALITVYGHKPFSSVAPSHLYKHTRVLLNRTELDRDTPQREVTDFMSAFVTLTSVKLGIRLYLERKIK